MPPRSRCSAGPGAGARTRCSCARPGGGPPRCGLTVTASVQALLVPPSHNAVLYSLATGGTISISALFMAGVFPGPLLRLSLILLCLVVAYRERHPRGQT